MEPGYTAMLREQLSGAAYACDEAGCMPEELEQQAWGEQVSNQRECDVGAARALSLYVQALNVYERSLHPSNMLLGNTAHVAGRAAALVARLSRGTQAVRSMQQAAHLFIRSHTVLSTHYRSNSPQAAFELALAAACLNADPASRQGASNMWDSALRLLHLHFGEAALPAAKRHLQEQLGSADVESMLA